VNEDQVEFQVEVEGDGNVVGDRSIAQVAKVEGGTTGDIVQVAGDYHAPPLTFWSTASALVARRWKIALALSLTHGILLFLYPTLQARYLVEPFVVIGTAVLATLVILGWSSLPGRQWKDTRLWVACVVVSLVLVGVLIWQTKQIMWPKQFSPQDFGIAVAYFGEGPDLKPSWRGKQITHDLVERLTAEVEKRDSPLSNVRARKIGIVKSSTGARRSGQRLGADLVVWGRLIVGEEGAVTVHFEALETPVSALNPEHPRVLPIGYAYSGEVTDQVIDIRGTHYFEIKEAIAGQSNAVTCFVLGLALYLEHDFQEAILKFEAAKEALKTESSAATLQKNVADLGLVHYYLGKSYQKLGRFEKAMAELEEAAEMNDRDPASRLDLAYSYRSLGRPEEADAVLREAVVLCNDILLSNPESEEALYDLGLAHQAADEYDDALDAFLRLTEVNPDFHIAYIGAGRTYALQGNFADAIQMYHRAIEKAARAGFNGACAHVDLGDVYLKQDNVEFALDEYLIAVQLEPEQDWMRFRLAQFYEAQGEIDLAWDEYEQLVKVSDNQVWANAVLGGFLRRQKLFDQAIESYKRARRFNPDDAMLYISLGETYMDRYLSPDGQERDVQEAERAFDEALTKLPEHFPVRFYVSLMSSTM
jgi:tetratricopeptide (TPR) repeat protein